VHSPFRIFQKYWPLRRHLLASPFTQPSACGGGGLFEGTGCRCILSQPWGFRRKKCHISYDGPLPSSYCHQPTAIILLPSAHCHQPTAISPLSSAHCHQPTAIILLPSAHCHHYNPHILKLHSHHISNTLALHRTTHCAPCRPHSALQQRRRHMPASVLVITELQTQG
jgi:hypothetical protein